MRVIKTEADLKERLNRALATYRRRDEMITLCDEMYAMTKERKSGFLGPNSTAWREKVSAEYWESSNKPQNVVDIMAATLAGNSPQFHCAMPGNPSSTIPSRAEMYLDGVWKLNSQRQQLNLYQEVVFKTVKHGGAVIHAYWDPKPPPAVGVETPVDPETNEPQVIQLHDSETFPICLEVINLAKVYPLGRGKHGRPFSELLYIQRRAVGDVLDEWEGVDGASLAAIKVDSTPEGDYTQYDYVEWWGQDRDNVVWYAITFNDHFIIRPTKTPYPLIPFVITAFKYNDGEQALTRLPFLYSIFHAVDKSEYVRSRSFRLIDMFAGMVPYHTGDTPLPNVDTTWGGILELGPNDKLQLPQWAGQPPDIYKEMAQLESEIAEGSFSQAMFGQISTRVSGYALSQVIGSDTLRTDTPRGNLELAYAAVANLIFKLMAKFSPNVSLSITAQIKSRKMAAFLSGEEARSLVTEVFVKPKQTADEIRLATLGAQISAQPNPPVSARYILEHYFGVNQPEEELTRKLDEEAMKDPIIRMMALIDVLTETGSPYAPIMVAQLQQAMGATMQGSQPPGAAAGMGAGLQQAMGGNEPIIPGSGNPSEENPTPEAALYGGPRE